MIQVLRESKEAPGEIRERVVRAGGVNRLGEANYRIVWGWSRLAWIGGKWADRDSSGNVIRERIELRQEPKYIPHDRWHIERWLPPEAFGTRAQWFAQTMEKEDGILIPALGPYPSRGEYEHCFTVQGPGGEFLPLTAAVCDAVVRAIEWTRRQPARALRSAIDRREQGSERAWDVRADALLEDAGRAFHGAPFVNGMQTADLLASGAEAPVFEGCCAGAEGSV
jgi:hypothetical protein